MAIKHVIRSKVPNKTVTVLLTARKAIMKHCKECFGWETSPEECKDKLCPLWPFRTYKTPKNTVMKSKRKAKK